MGACVSLDQRNAEESNASRAIDRHMRNERRKQDIVHKLLLLGSGESGKSTIFKQMKILHQNGFTKEELLSYRGQVYRNIIQAIKILIRESSTMGYDLGPLRGHADEIANVLDDEVVGPDLGGKIGATWKSNAIQSTFARANEFQISDCAAPFLNDVERLSRADYLPTEQDVLYVRVMTTTVVQTQWVVNGAKFSMFDVGGQRTERRKWMHFFDDVTAVIFVTAVSSYDQVLEEDSSTNRLTESLMLFEQVVNSRHFKDTSIVLFLNKIDLLKEKIQKSDLRICFQDYAGEQNYEDAIRYIEAQFVRLNRSPLRGIYLHRTCATDTTNIRVVFEVVRDIVLQGSINESGF